MTPPPIGGAASGTAPARRARGPRQGLYSFGLPAFRRLWLAAVLVAFANWMERLAVGWLVLEATGSVFLAAASFAVRQVPGMFLGPIGGAVADRVERRRLLTFTALAKAAIAAALGVLVYWGLVALVWPILLLLVLSGALRAFEFPATQALIVDIVGARNTTNAVGLYSMGTRSVGMLGAFSAGALLEFAAGETTFLLAALLLVTAALIINRLNIAPRPLGDGRPSLWTDVVSGLRLIAGIPVVATLLALTMAVEILAYSYQSMLPAVAHELLDVGALGLGVLTLGAGAGSVLGSLVLALLGDFERRGLLLLAVVFTFGAFLIAFGLSNVFLISLGLVVVVGAMAAMFDALQWILLQAHVPDEMRGRVLGAWMSAIGLGWLGPLTLGGVGEWLGVSWAISGAGTLVVLLWAVSLLFVPRLKQA